MSPCGLEPFTPYAGNGLEIYVLMHCGTIRLWPDVPLHQGISLRSMIGLFDERVVEIGYIYTDSLGAEFSFVTLYLTHRNACMHV